MTTTPRPRFSLFGVPVHVEPTFFVLPLLALGGRALAGALVWTALVFGSVLLHELGHALAMKRAGFAPAITLHFLGGFAAMPAGSRPTPRQFFFITLAGPGAGLALGGVAWLTQRLVVAPPPLLATALADAVWINLGWSLVNLLPVLPWDGGLALDAGLTWATGRPRARVVAACSVALGAGVVFAAVLSRNLLLGYFGFMGVTRGVARWREAEREVHDAATTALWDRLVADEDVTRELDAALATVTDPAARAQYLELLAWARLRVRDFAGAHAAVDGMGEFQPTAALRARLAAERDDVDAVIELLSPEGAAGPRELPLLVSAYLARQRFDEVVALAHRQPDVADLAATRLFGAGAFAHALELCTAERQRTGDGRFAFNEACCYCRLGRPDDAVTALQQAKALGYAELGALVQTDEDLEPIRNRPEVRALQG